METSRQPKDMLNDNIKDTEQPFWLKEKIYDMMCYGHPFLRNFPRRERKLADEIDMLMDQMLEISIIIQKKYYKATTLKEIDVKLDALRHFVRLAQDETYFNHPGNNKRIAPPLPKKQYEEWSRKMDEIGRIIGGLMAKEKEKK